LGVCVGFSLKRHSFSSFISFQAPYSADKHQILCHWHLQTVGSFEDFWYYCANWIVSWLIGALVTSHVLLLLLLLLLLPSWLIGDPSSFFFFFLVLFTFLPSTYQSPHPVVFFSNFVK
jgi:hypothetical protein